MNRILVAGIDEINPDEFRGPDDPSAHNMSYLNKPNGCLWGSSLLYNELYKSDWLRWVENEDFHKDKYKNGISFKLYKKSRICTIDDITDYIRVITKYNKSKYDDRPLPNRPKELVIDWVALSKDYDAFHLTEKGFWELRMLMGFDIPLHPNGIEYRLSDFYSYDCETWIMFNLECINKGSITNHHNMI